MASNFWFSLEPQAQLNEEGTEAYCKLYIKDIFGKFLLEQLVNARQLRDVLLDDFQLSPLVVDRYLSRPVTVRQPIPARVMRSISRRF